MPEGLPSEQTSLSEELPCGKMLLESWLEASEWVGRGSEGKEGMGRLEEVGLEVGRELT